jgi:hypothetical protein
MTEKEWLQFTISNKPFDYLYSRASDRKARLCAVAYCRSAEAWLTERCCRRAVEQSEQFADGLLPKQAMAAARQLFPASERSRLREAAFVRAPSRAYAQLPAASRPVVWSASWDACHWVLRGNALDAARLCYLAADVVHSTLQSERQSAELLRRLTHDIFGNPFRPVDFDPHWRTSDVVGLARAIYEHRAFDRMPILADALMDAGCADEQILDHCRGDGPHVRGCWVVDSVLNKK